VDALLGDASKAKATLGWKPKTTFRQLVQEMVKSDLALLGVPRRNGKISA
jgi:GDPmannose 4,6-dehydratase